MSRHVTKPESILIDAVRHLQKQRQHLDGTLKGQYEYDTVEKAEARVAEARKEVNKLIERFTQVVDYSLPSEERPIVIRGF